MTSRPFGLTALLFLTMSAGVAAASRAAHVMEPKAAKLEGMDYDTARRVILGYGWRPWSGPCYSVSGGCKRYPEIHACSASLPVRCGMNFVQKGRCLIVDTTGEAPPGFEPREPVVSDVTFWRGSCPSD
jgi:hypothetical protein